MLLGVAGGIASYKTAWLARLLSTAGAEVDVVMTRSATEFVGPVTFEALTGRRVHTGLFDDGRALEHIRLAKAAEVVVVAPATADLMARAATGQADDLLTAVLLATQAPVLIVPAMNDRMWAHAQTRANAVHLRALGYAVLEPDDGALAAGEGSGPGRMPEPDTIYAHVARLLERPHALRGRSVLVTAGPTREEIDPVRFISNHSSGRMGVAIAESAWRRGSGLKYFPHAQNAKGAKGKQAGIFYRRDGERRQSEKRHSRTALHSLSAPLRLCAENCRPSLLRPPMPFPFASFAFFAFFA